MVVSARLNRELQERYGRTVRCAVLVALLAHAAVFLVAPPAGTVSSTPALRPPVVVLVDPPADVRIPEEPQDVPRPSSGLPHYQAPEIPTVVPAPPAPPPPAYPPSARLGVRSDLPFVAVDEPPVPTYIQVPDYPALAREAGIEGTVRVEILIDEVGRVIEATVIESDVTVSMERAAVRAAFRCRFQPARQGTVAVKTRVMMPFSFVIE